jgi:hypothetical protein
MTVLALNDAVSGSADFEVSFVDPDGGRRCEPLSTCWTVHLSVHSKSAPSTRTGERRAFRACGGSLRPQTMSATSPGWRGTE